MRAAVLFTADFAAVLVAVFAVVLAAGFGTGFTAVFAAVFVVLAVLLVVLRARVGRGLGWVMQYGLQGNRGRLGVRDAGVQTYS